jgi:hypothetical protein
MTNRGPRPFASTSGQLEGGQRASTRRSLLVEAGTIARRGDRVRKMRNAFGHLTPVFGVRAARCTVHSRETSTTHFSSERSGSCLPSRIASVMSGAKKGQGDDPADVSFIKACLFCQSPLIGYFTAQNPIHPVMCSCDSSDQRGNRACPILLGVG